MNTKTTTNGNNTLWGSFNLTGKAIVDEITFGTNIYTQSNFIYNRMNLLIDCGEEHGYVTVDLFGSSTNSKLENFINHPTFNNFTKKFYQKSSTITVGLDYINEQIYYKNFLDAFNAIAYIQKYLTDGMIIDVEGDVVITTYSDNVETLMNVKKIAIHEPKYSFVVKKHNKMFV